MTGVLQVKVLYEGAQARTTRGAGGECQANSDREIFAVSRYLILLHLLGRCVASDLLCDGTIDGVERQGVVRVCPRTIRRRASDADDVSRGQNSSGECDEQCEAHGGF
jgi:hypothetical protein